MGSHDKVIDWLKKEGVKTRQQAIDKLTPLVRGLVVSSISLGGSLAGTANASDKILKAFPESAKVETKKVKKIETKTKKTIKTNKMK